jgi:hypothetical protein
MNKSEIVNYIISVLSIIVAVWQTIKNYNLKKYIRAESMELYIDTDVLRGSAQTCLKALQSGNVNMGIQEAGKVEGIAHTLFTRAVKNIHHHFNYKRTDIDNWIANNKIHEIHKNDFMKYADK